MTLFGRKKAAPVKARFSLPRWIRARFDAAQTTKDNARHWGAAEFLSADAEADSHVRKILRTRARYEGSEQLVCAGHRLDDCQRHRRHGASAPNADGLR